jgi:uncharacterized protein (TIGR03435 family)
MLRTGVLIFATVCCACGQTAGRDRGFEVVSIKQMPPPDGSPRGVGFSGGPGSNDPGRLRGYNVSLGNILVRAYGIFHFQLIAPKWIEDERYEFIAKVPSGAMEEQVPLMLRDMLGQRFKLKVHYETRQVDVYRLVTDNHGPRFNPSNPTGTARSQPQRTNAAVAVDRDGFPVPPAERPQTMTIMTGGHPHMTVVQMSMRDFATWLSSQIEHPIMDSTGLKGEYDFRLTWAPIGGHELSRASSRDTAAPAQDDGPRLFEAVRQQLGLRLVQGKGPLDVLVVEHIQRTPTPN